MPASYTIRRSVPRNTRRSKPASTPSTCFPSFSITCSWRFLSRVVICLPTQQTSYGNRKRHHHLVAAMPRYDCGPLLLRERAKLHVTEPDFGSFGLEKDLAAGGFRAGALVGDFVVHHELD